MFLVLSTPFIYLLNIYWVISKTCRAFPTLIGFVPHLLGTRGQHLVHLIGNIPLASTSCTHSITFFPFMLCLCSTLFKTHCLPEVPFDETDLAQILFRTLPYLLQYYCPLSGSQFWNLFLYFNCTTSNLAMNVQLVLTLINFCIV